MKKLLGLISLPLTSHSKFLQKTSLLSVFFMSCCILPTLSAVELFPFQAPKNFQIFIDQDGVYHPVTTPYPEAQRWFNQGLTLIYAFNHEAAYWSFQNAAEIDPNMAMAYWGMALAIGPNINMDITPEREKVAYEAIQKALQLSDTITDNEKAYIRALAIRYSDNPQFDRKQLAYHYKNAMKQVVDKFPDDLDAATLYAESALDLNPWKQWDAKGNPVEGTLAVVETLEGVIKRDPNHLGANHYYIHAIEASCYPERALMSAQRLRHMLPQSGHILHMPAHIYLLVGDYHTAAICNEEAVAADRAYIRKYGMQGIYPLHYLSHNLYFLSRAYSMEGRFEDAKRAGDDLYHFYAPYFQAMPELEYYIPTSLFVLLRFQRWSDILKAPAPDSRMLISRSLWHFARAMALASLGQFPQAQQEQNFFIKNAQQIPPNTMYGYNKAEDILAIAALVLRAKLVETQKDPFAALDFLQQAIAIQDQLNYNEPPDWFFPVRENLGGLLLRNQQYLEAEQVFRQDLNKHPRNGRALFGLLESLKGQKRYNDAFWVERQWEKAWRYSTTHLNLANL